MDMNNIWNNNLLTFLIQSRAKSVGIKVETLAYMKGDPGKDVCTVAQVFYIYFYIFFYFSIFFR